MSESHDEFSRRVEVWRQAGDTERLRLVELYHESYRFRESEPEYKLELLTRCGAVRGNSVDPAKHGVTIRLVHQFALGPIHRPHIFEART